MEALIDGTICHVVSAGTELEQFSAKSQRLVLLAYHNESTAFVYPLSTSFRKSSIRLERPEGPVAWIVVDKGLFRVPVSALTLTAYRWPKFGSIRERIKRDLAILEERAQADGLHRLTHRGLEELESLRGQVVPKPVVKPKPAVKVISDEKLFQQYLDRLGPEKK